MARREYILASDPPVRRRNGRVVREVMERESGSPWRVILVVANDDAVDVLTALRRAYQDGREDRAEEESP